MSRVYLLDTNVLSEPLRVSPDEGILEALRAHEGEIATATPVWHELWFGCARLRRSRRRTLIETYLRDVVAASLPILPYDQDAAAWHASKRARLSSRGRTPPFVDGQIAAIAATNDLVLVTSNIADFKSFKGLRVEDWRSA